MIISIDLTLDNPFVHLWKNDSVPLLILRGKCSSWLIYSCTGEHFQSDLDIFRFDFMFVKPLDVPPLFCFNVQTDMRFVLQWLLYPEGRRFKKGAVAIKLHIVYRQWAGIWFNYMYGVNEWQPEIFNSAVYVLIFCYICTFSLNWYNLLSTPKYYSQFTSVFFSFGGGGVG